VRGRLRKLGHGSGELRTLMPIAAEEGKKQQSRHEAVFPWSFPTGGGSHNHRFYPPEAAMKAMVPGLKIKAKGLTTGQAFSVLVQMFEEY